MVNHGEFAERLKLIRKTLGLKQKDFAMKLKISAPSLSEIEKGKYKPGHDFFVNISKEFNVNLYYLLFGEGEMFVGPGLVYSGQADSFAVNNKDVRQFLWYFERSKIVQYLILGQFRSILRNEKTAVEKDIEEYKTGTNDQE